MITSSTEFPEVENAGCTCEKRDVAVVLGGETGLVGVRLGGEKEEGKGDEK